jgi:RNA polymerase sigma factor (sigma-70 family)
MLDYVQHVFHLYMRPEMTVGPEVYRALRDTSTPEERIAKRERTEALAEAVLSLSPAQRRAVIAYYVEGMTFEEAGETFGVTRQAVDFTCKRGLKRLRETLLAWELQGKII